MDEAEMGKADEDILQKVQRMRESEGTGGRWSPPPNQDITPDDVYYLTMIRKGIKPAKDGDS